MRTLFTALALILFTGGLFSQNISVEEAVLARQNNLYPSSLSQLQWLEDENSYSYVKDDELIIGSYKGKEKTGMTLDKLNKICKLELSSFPRIQWKKGRSFSFNNAGNKITVNIKAGKSSSTTPPEDAENSDVHSTGSIAFTRANNLFLSANGKETQVTNNPPAIVSGQAFARYEFGIAKGTFWNPDGSALAFYQKDESMVPDYPLVDYSTTPAQLNSIKYPMAGGPSEKAKTGIYHLKEQTVVFLKTGRLKEDKFYITNLEWHPDGKSVFVAIVNRDQNEMQLHRYDAKSGELLKVLFVEKDSRYVEPEHPALFLPNNSNQFLWFSEKSGFNNLQKYDLNGKLIAQTNLKFPITSFIGFNAEGSKAFVMGTGENATESHLFAVNLEDMKVAKITNSSGSHRVKMSHDGTYFIDQWSSLTVPGRTEVLTSTGKMAGILHTSEDPLAGKQTGEVSLLEIEAQDGTMLHARMITPPNFDKKKRYPVLVYVYNGPHVQLVTNRWNGGAPLWMNSLAGDGYIVFSVDGRGSANRGKDFEQAIHRNLGVLEVQDQLDGVAYLKDLPYVDAERMAVHGWSYGGFMTTSLMLKSPGTFQVGVAGGPVIDWNYYEVMYTERYMDTPEQNPEGYKNANLKNYVKNLDGKLLMIHGTVDDVVVMQHNMSFLKACIDDGVQIDFFAYPGHPHNVRGKDRVHLMTKVINYVKDNL